MVSHRSVTVALVSIPGVTALPEYASPIEPDTPSRSELPDPFVDNDVSEASATTRSSRPGVPAQSSSLIPIYALRPPIGTSQIWVHYKIAAPHPPKAYYFFKVFIDGRPITSWGVGHKEGFRGTVKFAPTHSDTASTFHVSQDIGLEPKEHGSEDIPSSPCSASSQATIVPLASFTVRVYRANGRKKAALPDLSDVPNLPRGCGSSVNLVPSVKLPERQPRKYYQYSLIDPIDLPFATFQYHLKSEKELAALGTDLVLPANIVCAPSLPSTPSGRSSLKSPSDASSPKESETVAFEEYKSTNEDVDASANIDNPIISSRNVSLDWQRRPLSRISERDYESPEKTPSKRSLALAYKPSQKNLRAQPRRVEDAVVEVQTEPKTYRFTSAWPLDTEKPLPDLPSEELTPRPRGGHGTSHTLLITRFPKFASSSTITSTNTLSSTISDAPSDPFVTPGSPLGRGDPLPSFLHPSGLRCHPPLCNPLRSNPPHHHRVQSWDSHSSTSNSPTSGPTSTSFAAAYASSLGSGFERSESVSSIGRAVSRPDKQRPPTPLVHGLDEGAIEVSARALAEYLPRLGPPPVFFPQPAYPLWAGASGNGSTDGSVAGFSTTRSATNPPRTSFSPPRPSHSPPPPKGPFPARRSSIRNIAAAGRKRPRSSVSTSSSSSTTSSAAASRADLKRTRTYSPSSSLAALALDDPHTPQPHLQRRANLSKFFGEDIDNRTIGSARSSIVAPDASAGGQGARWSGQLRKKGSNVFAMGKGLGKDVWDSARKFHAKKQAEWEEAVNSSEKEHGVVTGPWSRV